ncbi:MAG: SpoIIE family protein phosphatase [Lachnospiraceae bacterium]|nr:SpoIIE family protein phosphatase [Lachnospiraceae bacterium]
MEWSKYVLALLVGGCFLILFGRKGDGKDKWILGGAVGFSLAAMELVVEYMLLRPFWERALSVMRGGALFSAIVLLGYAREWLAARGNRHEERETIHPIRQWIEDCQESFDQLSRSFCMELQPVEGLDRGERLLQNRLQESRLAAAGQIHEMSQILTGAMERIYGTREDEELEQEIGKCLRLMGVQVQKVFFYGPQGRKRQVYVTMRTRRKICVPVRKVSAVLSELLDCEMMAARDSRTFISQERVTVLFVEGIAYNVLYGVQKSTRQGEPVSGDNFSVFWLPEGKFYAGLSDGMGSGIRACSQSETVLDLLEQFLEAGFSKETAVRMINSSIVLQPDARVLSTVDLASIDLYSGVCEFLKIGSAPSFLKKENGVECIRSVSLPAGAAGQLVLEPYRIRMYDGNLLFLVTDGVLSALPAGEEERTLRDLIAKLPVGAPSETARRLLEQVRSCGEGTDDMTVLVVGIWKR